MKNILKLALISIVALIYSCSSDEANNNDSTNSGFFISGKGLKKVWTMKSARNGLGSFNNGHLSYSSDGYVNMMFAYGNAVANSSSIEYQVYRKKINFSTGVATDESTPSVGFTSGAFMEDSGNITFIPNTNLLAYIYNGSIVGGEASWLPISGFELMSKIYENRQILQSSFNQNNNEISAIVYNNGTYTSERKLINNGHKCWAIDLTLTGVPLVFTAANPNLEVRNYATNSLLKSNSINLYQNQPANIHLLETKMRTKRSIDGTKIIGLIYQRRQIPGQAVNKAYTTFIYTIASNTFSIKVDNQAPVNFNDTLEDFDEQGNIYYANTEGADYQIKKMTPTGEQVVSSGFMTTGYVNNIKAIGDKVFVVIKQDGNTTNSDDRGKGTIMLTVLD